MASLEEYFIYAATCILVSIIFLLVLSRRQRESLLAYIPIFPRGRRTSTSRTPPRSLSPEKKVPNNGPSPVDYKDIFPPSSREALARVVEAISLDQQRRFNGQDVDQIEFKKGVIPFTADYRECGPLTYTPTEISIEEVRALGDFPNYAELSGVPLPQAYDQFKIERALPRPYRPFRWAYHQTMCMLLKVSRK